MMTTSVETPGAAARICMRGEYRGALAATQRERERGQGREGAHLALGVCSFNSGGCVLAFESCPCQRDATLQHKILDDIAVAG